MMSGRIRKAGAVFASVMLLAGCGDSLFSSLEDPRDVEVRLAPSGAYVSLEGAIELELSYRSERVESLTALTVQFRSGFEEDQIVDTMELAPSSLTVSGVLSVPVPVEAGPGVYRLEITGWRGSTELFTESRQIFLASELPVVRQLFLHPTRPVIDSSMLALAVLDVPEGQRPWLRWFLAGELLAEGYLEEGFDQMILPAGSSSGAYAVRLDILPWGPEEGVHTVSLETAPVTARAELFVQDDFDPGDLLRDGESLVWYPLQGHLRSAVRLQPALETERIFPDGNPEAVVSDEVFLQILADVLGYFVPGGSTLEISVPVLPELERTQVLDLDLVVPSGSGGRVLTLTGPEDVEFALWIDPSGNVLVEQYNEDVVAEGMDEPEEEFADSRDVNSPESAHNTISLTVELASAGTVSWEAMSGGISTGTGESLMEESFSQETRLVIGGEGSVPLLVGSIALRWLATDDETANDDQPDDDQPEDETADDDQSDDSATGSTVVAEEELDENADSRFDATVGEIPDSSDSADNEGVDEN